MLGPQPDYLLRLSQRTTVVVASYPSKQHYLPPTIAHLLFVTAHQAERNASICDGEVTLRSFNRANASRRMRLNATKREVRLISRRPCTGMPRNPAGH